MVRSEDTREAVETFPDLFLEFMEAVTAYQRKSLFKRIISLFLPFLVCFSANFSYFFYLRLQMLAYEVDDKQELGRSFGSVSGAPFILCLRVTHKKSNDCGKPVDSPMIKSVWEGEESNTLWCLVVAHDIRFLWNPYLSAMETNQFPNSIFGGTSFDAQVKKGTEAREQNMPKCLSREKLAYNIAMLVKTQEGSKKFRVLVECQFFEMCRTIPGHKKPALKYQKIAEKLR
ncbi:hypothetical protein RHMOL_Rhmol03G0010700 [Rhododendron molle]|uniref:Uncharacterized protein n=1 Tax=Rhododendron molle TaxID=49168 RepID=A0ACC0PAE9_RHOML|nr:hypothetical protein RHMOL_Rhmol03G0010700 [Rhododendron molle]